MDKPVIYYRRYHGYDYSRGAALFVTIATEPRRALFGRVENAAVIHSELGCAVLEAMRAIPRLNPGISLFEHVLMPDHLHMNLRIEPGLAEPLQVFGAAIRRYKTFTTTLARKALGLQKLWQQGYHDRICTSRRFIDSTARYIQYNPLKYELMYNQPEFSRDACLTLNDQIAAMALAGEGGTLYWQKDGPFFRKAEPGLRGAEPGLRGAKPANQDIRRTEPAIQDKG